MPLIDDTRRWIKDQFSHDEYISGTPKEKIQELNGALVSLSQSERTRNVEAVRAYATYYYQGRHNEPIPAEIRQKLTTMDQRVERLNSVDAAREILHKHGGPPSRQTIAESIERSIKERSLSRETVSPAVQREKAPAKERKQEVAQERKQEIVAEVAKEQRSPKQERGVTMDQGYSR